MKYVINLRKLRIDAISSDDPDELELSIVLPLRGRISDLPGPITGALTRRQADVLKLIAWGRTIAEVADELDVGESTIAKHLKLAYARLGTRNRSETLRLIRDAWSRR